MTNKNNHTTSTKCQYQAAASNPKWCFDEKCLFDNRAKHTAKKVVPIITWRPWNPVAIKNVEPYTESANENGASMYSYPWSKLKYTPKITVIRSPCFVCVWLFSIKLWWAHVTETPEERRMMVFNKGIWKGLNAEIFFGGHSIPTSIAGANLEWKKAQKKEMKKRTSEVINKIIPSRMLVSTSKGWCPWREASRDTSRHHWVDVTKRIIIPAYIRILDFPWNHLTVPDVIIKAPRAPVRGQGLWSTIWKGWK